MHADRQIKFEQRHKITTHNAMIVSKFATDGRPECASNLGTTTSSGMQTAEVSSGSVAHSRHSMQ